MSAGGPAGVGEGGLAAAGPPQGGSLCGLYASAQADAELPVLVGRLLQK